MKAVIAQTNKPVRGVSYSKEALEGMAEKINSGATRPVGWTKCRARLEHAGGGEWRLVVEGEGPRR